jgi:hypothetical protein
MRVCLGVPGSARTQTRGQAGTRTPHMAAAAAVLAAARRGLALAAAAWHVLLLMLLLMLVSAKREEGAQRALAAAAGSATPQPLRSAHCPPWRGSMLGWRPYARWAMQQELPLPLPLPLSRPGRGLGQPDRPRGPPGCIEGPQARVCRKSGTAPPAQSSCLQAPRPSHQHAQHRPAEVRTPYTVVRAVGSGRASAAPHSRVTWACGQDPSRPS